MFTLDGKETFLTGASYYGALSAADPEYWEQDMHDMARDGLNWIRVWAYWKLPGEDGKNVSAMKRDGSIREAWAKRLEDLVAMCDRLGFVVDVTLFREAKPDGVAPADFKSHRRACVNIARRLLPYRNVYIDIANERDVGDARYVSLEECGKLIRAIKSVDPKRLCTASCRPVSAGQMKEILEVAEVDFITPHLCRDKGCPEKTEATVEEYHEWMKSAGKTVPVHLQEPFRRGYGRYEPNTGDFLTDLKGAIEGGAAGWCFHNGAQQGQPPYRSFSLTASDGRLYKQLDDAEIEVMTRIKEVLSSKED
jgi:hypothetical protein